MTHALLEIEWVGSPWWWWFEISFRSSQVLGSHGHFFVRGLGGVKCKSSSSPDKLILSIERLSVMTPRFEEGKNDSSSSLKVIVHKPFSIYKNLCENFVFYTISSSIYATSHYSSNICDIQFVSCLLSSWQARKGLEAGDPALWNACMYDDVCTSSLEN